MLQEKFLFYLETIYKAFGVPMVYCSEDETIYHLQPFSVREEENEFSFIINRLQGAIKQFPDKTVLLLQHPKLIFVGMVTVPESREFVFIGPLAAADAREEDIADYLFTTGLNVVTTRKLSTYLNSSKIWTPSAVSELLKNINLVLNDVMIDDEEIGHLDDYEIGQQTSFYKEHFNRESERQEIREPLAIQDYTNRLNYCLENGDTNLLMQLLSNMESVPFSTEGPATLARVRQTAYGSVFASETVALKSGIPPANLSTVKQYYLDRIDRATNIEDCRRLLISAMFDFAKCVKKYRSEKIENPAISRAIEYIKENLNSKLMAKDIAAAVHVSTHYLFIKFKSETGKTLSEYINTEKIKKACYYIIYTDNSFSEIANFLSFSSQSYFQSVFKKIMGQTPNEWKLANKK